MPADRPTAHAPHPPHRVAALLLGLACTFSCLTSYAFLDEATKPPGDGSNPHPVHLRLPRPQPLSAVARLGKALFFDPMLSGSGRQSCASCHSPAYGYNPPNTLTVQPGGVDLRKAGYRPPPSLAYLYRQRPFSIGPDRSGDDAVPNLAALATAARNDPRATKQAGAAPTAPAMVPQGGLFWDGRADSLQRQAYLPLLNPVEMANRSTDEVAARLVRSHYRQGFVELFGPGIVNDPRQLIDEAMFAIGRFEIEDPSFHPFTSKYDAWLQGQARLTPAEMRGLRLFNDPAKGNCAACHLDQPTRDGLPPLFTDTQYEALGVPRNTALAANRDPRFHDLGLCGPLRKDLAAQTQYCGMFLTPTLRNVDRRAVFFHNGVYHSLTQVLDFYNLRSVAPEKIYPRDAHGKLQVYDDLPAANQANVDTADAPFDRRIGDQPPLTAQDIRDILAFLHTLDDGYRAKASRNAGP
ncbi:cytochrome-c peroxidase [Rhodanobacter geophilus]|uniref:Cytochrome-c peroxidase n=1 Tax=Rhodanobacter geophilus TaxID=3162488 RepID=A0ABV3QPV3_9GAMM